MAAQSESDGSMAAIGVWCENNGGEECRSAKSGEANENISMSGE